MATLRAHKAIENGASEEHYLSFHDAKFLIGIKQEINMETTDELSWFEIASINDETRHWTTDRVAEAMKHIRPTDDGFVAGKRNIP